MFTDGQLLLLLLWGIYLCDCLVWHDRYGVVFRSWWGVRWHVAGLEFGAGGMGKSNWEVAGHGMACVNPLECGAQAVVGHVLPVAISPNRVVAGNLQTIYATGRPPQGNRSFSLEELTGMAVREEELWLNGTRFCRFPSAGLARRVLALLRTLQGSPQERREELIRAYWRERFDRQAFRDLWASCTVAARRLQWGCMGLFLLLYVVAPVLALRLGTGWAVLGCGPLGVLAAFAIEWGAFRARRRLGVGTLAEAFGEWVKGVLCPPVAIRAADGLTRAAAPLFDPLTLAAELLPEEGRRPSGKSAFFARVAADWHHPLTVEGTWGEAERATLAWQSRLALDEALHAFPELGEELSERVPLRLDPAMNAYCPRCGGQYATEAETCPDCPGVRLEQWREQDKSVPQGGGKQHGDRRRARRGP